MKLLRIGSRVLLLALVMLTSLLGVAPGRIAAQAGATSFTSPMTGIPIEASAPWSIDTTSVLSQDGVESITLNGEYEFMQVWFLPGDVDLVEARDVVLDSFAQSFGSFVTVDRGAYGNVSYSLDITSAEGMEFGVFSLFLGQRESGYVEYYVFFGALSLFAQGLTSAQQHVTVNGAAVFGGVDGTGLQNLLLANAGVTGTTSTTTTEAPPVPTQAPVQPPAQPTQAPQPPTTTGTSGSPEGDAYLAALEAEAVYLEGTIGDFLNAYMTIDTNSDTAVQEMSRVAQEWASYPQRASGIVAPAGYETIDAQYRSVVTYVEGLASGWNDVVTSAQAGDGTATSQLAMLVLDVASLQTEIDALRTAMGGQGSTTTTQPTQAPADQPTQAPQQPTTTTGTLTPEQSTYIQTIRGESTALAGSLDQFVTLFGSIADGSAANPDQTIADLNAILDMWSSYPQTAAQNVAPAGMEEIDAAYQQLASDFAAMSDQFRAYAGLAGNSDPGANAALDQFLTQLQAAYGSIDSLTALLDQYESAGSSTTTTTQPPAQPTQPPAQTPTETTGTAGGEQYLATISTEVQNIQDSLTSFSEGFDMLGSSDSAVQDQGVAKINEVVNYWATYDQVAAGIVAPAGFEQVDAAYRQLATDVVSLATLFQAWLDAPDASSDAASAEFSTGLDTVQNDITALQSMLDNGQAGSTTTTTTTTTTPTQAPTETTTTGSQDGEAYLQSIADETQAIQDSITSFGEGFQLLGSADTAEKDRGVSMINDAVNYWATYDQVAAGIVAPAGYEDVDASYRQLATDVVSLATLFQAWLDAPDASSDAASAEFSTMLDTVQSEISALQQMVGTGGQTASTTTTTTTTTPTEQPQDTGGDITETGRRGQLPQSPGSDQPQDTGSTAGGSEADLGLVSDGEYVSPQLGLTITWDDRFTFDSEYIEDVIGSNEDSGEDWLTLVWTNGTSGDITMTVAAAEDFSPADAVAYWESDEYLSQFDMPAEVVLSEAADDRGGVMIRLDDGADGLVLYREAVCLSRRCDEVAYIMTVSAVDDTADLLADAEEGIEIEGEPATGVFSTREINRELDRQ